MYTVLSVRQDWLELFLGREHSSLARDLPCEWETVIKQETRASRQRSADVGSWKWGQVHRSGKMRDKGGFTDSVFYKDLQYFTIKTGFVVPIGRKPCLSPNLSIDPPQIIQFNKRRKEEIRRQKYHRFSWKVLHIWSLLF